MQSYLSSWCLLYDMATGLFPDVCVAERAMSPRATTAEKRLPLLRALRIKLLWHPVQVSAAVDARSMTNW